MFKFAYKTIVYGLALYGAFNLMRGCTANSAEFNNNEIKIYRAYDDLKQKNSVISDLEKKLGKFRERNTNSL